MLEGGADQSTVVNTVRQVRHAEKVRTASDPLADEIARCVLQKYRSLLAQRREEVGGAPELLPPRQTVVAGVVVVDNTTGSTCCISVGQGTKFLHPDLLADALEDPRRVRDSHAEVLARRGAKMWHRAGGCVPQGSSIAFYSSSAPCGNSCLKKWARNTNEADTLPHPTFNVSAREAGQVAPTVKGDFRSDPAETEPPVDGIQRWVACGVSAPVGTTPTVAMVQQALDLRIASCSDKLACWNVLGLQGHTCSSRSPLNIRYVVVGRKYGNSTLRRALCCRLDLPGKKKIPGLAVPHPLMLCTSVPLDESTYDVSKGEGADFLSPICLYWYEGSPLKGLGCIDGSTGLSPAGEPPLVSRQTMYSDCGGREAYTAAKRGSEYEAVKALLHSRKLLLSPYPRRVPPEPRGVKRSREGGT